mgnify:CR=1 FL=1
MDKLESYVKRYNEINEELINGSNLDRRAYEKLAKEQSSLSEYVELDIAKRN